MTNPSSLPTQATQLAHLGSHPLAQQGFVNPPIYRGSTVVFPNADTMRTGNQRYHYGRTGNPTRDALIEAMGELEAAEGVVLCPSGLSACTTAILAAVSAGDHLLVPDSVYTPTRQFCETIGKRFGIETTYYDPCIGAGIESLFRPNTRAVYTESPGSLTFEIQDIPAISAVARRHDALVLMDNTWATPLFFKPLAAGVDLSITSATKYIIGHSDGLLGTIAAGPRAWESLKNVHAHLGQYVSPDDVSLALRGLRTLGIRLAQHQQSALQVAQWLEARPEVERVLYPALPSHPQHTLWQRDFRGASGLLSFLTKTSSSQAVDDLLDSLAYFPLGFSWGGFESLASITGHRLQRQVVPWTETGHLIRLHIGLEDPQDLIQDLEKGFERLNARL